MSAPSAKLSANTLNYAQTRVCPYYQFNKALELLSSVWRQGQKPA